MKILSINGTDGPMAGIVLDEDVFDVRALLDDLGPAFTPPLADFGALVGGRAPLLERLATNWPRIRTDAASLAAARVGPLSQLQLGPPVRQPSKILCAGLNYVDHVAEIGARMPNQPQVFSKLASALNGPYSPIRYPVGVSEAVDYEVELAIVIGRVTRSTSVADARSAVAGYMVVNDVSARDWQFNADAQLTLGKGFDTFFPSGPWVTTADEVPDPQSVRLRCWVDGELVQDSNTAQLIKGVDELVSWLSRVCTLLPGDIIATGTPPGVGMGRKPPRYLAPGQTVVCEIDQLGRLENQLVSPQTDGDDNGW
jgi:2-keto-4-pentenoate hydratase/2-oxohepta-3-ene-1,7-dioic acid hydratase in catechol pathway